MSFKNLFNKSGDQLAKEAISDYQSSKDEFAVINKLEKALNIGIQNYPLDVIYLYIGSSYFDLSIYDKANEAYKKGLEHNPKNHSLLSNLGLSYSLMGDPEKSIEYYRASLEIKPDNSYAHNNIGLYNYEKGNHLKDVKNLLVANHLPENDSLDEFESELKYSDAEELLISVASKLKVSNSIELLNIWTSEHILNIYPIEQAKWISVNYPFINTDNGFGRIYPLATNDAIENFLTPE